eukprot:3304923-Prymnesium_polylepis.1
MLLSPRSGRSQSSRDVVPQVFAARLRARDSGECQSCRSAAVGLFGCDLVAIGNRSPHTGRGAGGETMLGAMKDVSMAARRDVGVVAWVGAWSYDKQYAAKSEALMIAQLQGWHFIGNL